eukprot:jgi/Astpho2/1965/Aster-00474
MGRILGRLKGVDFYRRLPSDLTEATLHGAGLSVLAAFIMMFLLIMAPSAALHWHGSTGPLLQELNAYLSVETTSSLVVDRSAHGDLLRVNFNISFPEMTCEFATLDVSDSLGTKRLNLTKTVRKLPISQDLQRQGHYIHDDRQLDIKYDDLPAQKTHGNISLSLRLYLRIMEHHTLCGLQENDTVNYAAPLSRADFDAALEKYSIFLANFYAPWCPWCQRLEPTWEAVQQKVHDKYPDADGRIRMGKVDCTKEVELCREHLITGFPSIRVFRKGHDEISTPFGREHEAYRGDRTEESLLAFADTLAPTAGQPHYYIRGVNRVAKSTGCALSGFVLVKKSALCWVRSLHSLQLLCSPARANVYGEETWFRDFPSYMLNQGRLEAYKSSRAHCLLQVPGTLHFVAKAPGHSFDHSAMNLSHSVGYFYFGNKPSPRRRKALEKYHPLGLTENWSDKLASTDFYSPNQLATFEHHMQARAPRLPAATSDCVVLTSIEPRHHNSEARFDAYEYTVHSHMYNPEFEQTPSAKFSYDMSPVQIVVTEKPKALYHFITTLCAIIGGVFTVAGILDGVVNAGVGLRKKLDLGKQG